MKASRIVTWVSLVASAVAPLSATAEPVDMARRAEELKALKWGLFVCWSFSTFSGKEWTPGVTDVSFFTATGCDTDQWARAAQEAGMGYILFLTKHHDGFCLWDTQTTDRKVTKSPLGRDVLAEFTYPILPPHEGGAMWFYSRPSHEALCHPAAKLYRDYLGAVKFGNIFSLDVGPDYAGRLRAVDVQTLRQVGEMIHRQTPDPSDKGRDMR
jgi:hypothetical protein